MSSRIVITKDYIENSVRGGPLLPIVHGHLKLRIFLEVVCKAVMLLMRISTQKARDYGRMLWNLGEIKEG